MKYRLSILLIFYLLAGNPHLYAQLSNDATISILTCRAGDDIYNMFGHSAIRVVDSAQDLDVVYNYGLFDFSEPGFVIKFLRGKLKYWVGKSSYKAFMRTYVQEKRSVLEQILSLDQGQKNQLYQALQENNKLENRFYKYVFFFDNCSTRIRDILQRNVALLSYSEDEEATHSFRQLLDKFNYVSPWIDFGMDLLIGTPSDQKADSKGQMFLPENLYKQLARTSVGHSPLVIETRLLLDHEGELDRRSKGSLFPPALFFGLMLLLELFLFFKKGTAQWVKKYDTLFWSILGIGGCLLLFMWLGTDHITTKNNLNLLWMNPLFLILAFKPKKQSLLIGAGLMVLTLLLATFLQQLHVAAIIIVLISLLKALRRYRQTD